MPRTNFVKVDEEDEKKVPEPKLIPKKKFTQNDLVLCKSVTLGGLSLTGAKSKEYYRWEAYGDEAEVEFGDLQSLVRSKSSYIFGPMFVIEDQDVIDEFPEVKKFYEESYTVQDLEGVLDLDVDSMIKTMNTLPKRALTTLKSIASTQVSNGRLDSVKKIRALDDFFGTELNLLHSLYE